MLRSSRFERRDQSPALTKGILRNNRGDPLRSWQDPILRKAADISLGVLCFLLNRCCSRRGMEWRVYLEPHWARSTESRDPGAAPGLQERTLPAGLLQVEEKRAGGFQSRLNGKQSSAGGLNCKQSVKPPVPGPRLES